MRSIPHTPIFGIFLETFNLKINVLLIIVLGMVLVFSTSLATTVHAKESVPPSPPETFPSEEIETIEADVAADQLAEETPDEVDPVQENTPAPEADFPPPPPEDASGEADPDVAFDASGASDVEQLSSDAISPGVESEPAEEAEPVEQILPEQSPVIPDPYFFVGGTKHSFLPEGGDCAGAENCTVSTTP
ncbi:MAG: hypothetical protein H8E28_16100, partial [Anaerolineae bacterium]|nr:hypothetical protein [Anaerolineae bacterium]